LLVYINLRQSLLRSDAAYTSGELQNQRFCNWLISISDKSKLFLTFIAYRYKILNMSNGNPPHTDLILFAKHQSGLLPDVLTRIMPEFIDRGWTIHGDDSIRSAWADANLPPDKFDASIPNTAALALALGGDGTILRAARQLGFSGIPILGINLGFLGFLTAHPADIAGTSIQKYFNGQLIQDERCTLRAKVSRNGTELKSYEVLNDVVITKGFLSRILNLDLMIDGNFAAHLRADGLIVATPTGSTAYALSAGGPILYPTLKAWTLAPICPHSLNMRPIVVPSQMAVTVVISYAEEAHLTFDGQVGCPLQPGDNIQMYDAGGRVILLKDPEVPFFTLLRQKMHWNRE
jgi:NAD+ kinase